MKTQTRAAAAKARTIGLVRALKRNGLGKRRRKVPRTKYPLAIERAYAVEIARLVHGAMAEVRRQIEPELARWSEEFQNEVRADAAVRLDQGLPGRIGAFVKRVANAFLEAVRPTALEDLARRFASRTNTWSREQTNKQVRAALGVDVFTAEPNLAPLVDAFLAENVALIRTVPQKFLEDVEGVVLRGVTSGTLPRDIAKQLAETEGVAERRATLIARDQVGKFYGRLNEVRQKRLGVTTYTWSTVGDSRVRPEHEEREGKVYAWSKEDAKGDVEYLPPEEQPGQPINCFPGETLVRSPSPVHVAYRRWFDGELTVLVTDSGETLHATPNHPIRTAEGWVAAHLLNVGDHVLKAPTQGVELRVGDPQRPDTSIEELHRAACSLGVAHRVRGAAAGFHGDGSDEEVDVVDVGWGLGLEVEPGLAKSVCEKVLPGTDEATLRAGAAHLALLGVPDSSYRLVRGVGDLLALLGAGVRHSNQHGLTAVARLDAVLNELVVHGVSRDAEVLRDLLHAPPVGVELRDHVARVLAGVVRGALVAGDDETRRTEARADVIRASADSLRSLGERGSGEHEFTRVVEKRSVPFAGHVFNLGTGFGWYVAHNLTVHNCRCAAEPSFDDLLDSLG